MGNENAVFLNLATEFVQYVVRLILKATQTLSTWACHVLVSLELHKNVNRISRMIYVIFLLNI